MGKLSTCFNSPSELIYQVSLEQFIIICILVTINDRFQITTVIFVCLWLFDSFPLFMCSMGILANVVHILVLKDYPAITITSFPFIMTVGKMIISISELVV